MSADEKKHILLQLLQDTEDVYQLKVRRVLVDYRVSYRE